MATILVVDDHPVNRKLLAAILRPQGHTLLEAADGAEALEVVRTTRPDLIIIDLAMPRMGGAGFLRARREIDGLRDVPVVLYTATYRSDEARALADDPAVVSVVPASPETLVSRLTPATTNMNASLRSMSRSSLSVLLWPLAESTARVGSPPSRARSFAGASRSPAHQPDDRAWRYHPP